MTTTSAIPASQVHLPEEGISPAQIREELEGLRTSDVDWHDGKAQAPVYFAGDDVLDVARDAYMRFFSENPLHRHVFPSLTRMAEEIIGMTSNLFHNPNGAGSVTSGGTESILLAIKTYRDRARAEHPEITAPEILAPFTAHPAFSKGAQYFDLKIVRTPIAADYTVDLNAYRAAITPNTVMMVGSAPDYPYGVIDPIPEMAALAAEASIPFHTDACVGGFYMPFVERLGEEVTPWDFRVPGVTSISADLHKFGYAARGASTLTWRDTSFQQHQWFDFDEWPSGRYRTQSITGTKPAGGVAAAWAVLNYVGVNGYVKAVKHSRGIMRTLVDGINGIRGLEVLGKPAACILSYAGDDVDIYAVATGMEDRGWSATRGDLPPSIHIMLFNAYDWAEPGSYVRDLAEVVALVRAGAITARENDVRYG